MLSRTKSQGGILRVGNYQHEERPTCRMSMLHPDTDERWLRHALLAWLPVLSVLCVPGKAQTGSLAPVAPVSYTRELTTFFPWHE